MSEFLVEAYHPPAGARDGAPSPWDVASAADQLTCEGHKVSLVRAVLVPEDETCLYLFEATSFEAVLESTTRSGLCFERVVPALSSWIAPRGAEHTRDLWAEGRATDPGEQGGLPLHQ